MEPATGPQASPGQPTGGITLSPSPEADVNQVPEVAAEEAIEEPPEPPPAPEWKVLDPEGYEEGKELFPHERCENQKMGDGWTITAASLRGKLHAHKSLWREDAYLYDQVDHWTIMAVSDGAGSAPLSRVGAKVSCEESVGALKEMLSGYVVPKASGDTPSTGSLKQLKAFLTLATYAARDGIIREAHDRGISEKDLYCTLLLAIHTRWKGLDLIGALQVGDGAIGVFTGDEKCTLMGVADHGEYSSETVFLTSWKQLVDLPYHARALFTVKRDVRCIAAMCDGVSDDFFPEEKRLIELFIGNPISGILTKSEESVKGVMFDIVKKPRDGKALLDWLRYEKKASSDDRTLLLMHRK